MSSQPVAIQRPSGLNATAWMSSLWLIGGVMVLVGMGILPLKFMEGQNVESLGLTGEEVFDIEGLSAMRPKEVVSVRARKTDDSVVEFKAIALLNTEVEVNYYRNGGILHTVLRNLVK